MEAYHASYRVVLKVLAVLLPPADPTCSFALHINVDPMYIFC